MHDAMAMLGQVLDEVQVEALAGLQLYRRAQPDGRERQVCRTTAELVRLADQGRRLLTTVRNNRKAACGCNPQAA